MTIKAATHGHNILCGKVDARQTDREPSASRCLHLDLSGALKRGRLAMADPDSVPDGKYGRAAVEKLGVWSSVRTRRARRKRSVSRRDAPIGIVYATDAAAIYPAALTADSKKPTTVRLLEFLASQAARPPFEKQGLSRLR